MLRQRLQERLEGLTDAREATQELAREAPGANTTRSDQSKNQLSTIQLAQQSTELDMLAALDNLRQLPTEPRERIVIGAIFTLRKINNGEESPKIYFVVPAGCGGEELDLDGKIITTLTAIAPLAVLCRNKEEGDEVTGGGGTYEIVTVE